MRKSLLCVSTLAGALLYVLLQGGCTHPELAPLPPVQTVKIDAEPDSLAAPWDLFGPSVMISGEGDTTLNVDIPPGTFRIAWGSLPEWNTPFPDTLELQESSTITFSGTYIRVTGSIEFTLVPVPAGDFLMGSLPGELGGSDEERPQHQVTVSAQAGRLEPFLISTTEVTQAQWTSVVGTNPSWFAGCDDCPVERVSWNDIINFCNLLSDRDGFTRAYTVAGTDVTWDPAANGYRLPTEAEWEYACRAGSSTALNNGNIGSTGCAPEATLDQVGWFCGNSVEVSHLVAQKDPNAWGLYDMHGNVWEWVWDGYTTYTAASEENPAVDPNPESFRIMRGGSWLYGAQRSRSAYRQQVSPGSVSSDLGFRIARFRDPSEKLGSTPAPADKGGTP